MGLLSVFNPSAWWKAFGNRAMASNLSDPSNRSPSADFWYYPALGFGGPSGGVTDEAAWQFISVGIAAMRILVGIGADMPLQRKQTTKVSGRAITNVLELDPVHRLLNAKANRTMLSMSFRALMLSWQVGRGTAFAEIERDLTGKPLALWPIHPSRMEPVINEPDDALWWKVRNKDGSYAYIADVNMLRIPYTLMDDDGIHGMGIGKLAARTLGLGATLERTEQAASSSALPRIVVEIERRMQEPEQKAFRSQWAEWQAGNENLPVLLVDGAKAKPLMWSATDSDHRMRREFNRADIATAFGVPLDLINGTGDPLLFHKLALPYLSIWEQECDDKLLTEEERDDGHFFQNDYRALLKADPVARSQYWTNRVNIGSATPNEVRYSEGDNPSATDGADVEYIQGAMRRLSDPYKMGAENPLGNPKDGKAPPLAPQKPGKAAKSLMAARKAVSGVLVDALSRAAVREMKRATTDAKNPRAFLSKVDEFYAEHVDHMGDALRPLCDAARDVAWPIDAATVSATWCRDSRAALLAASECPASGLSDAVAVAVAAWNTTRVETFVESLKPWKAKSC